MTWLRPLLFATVLALPSAAFAQQGGGDGETPTMGDQVNVEPEPSSPLSIDDLRKEYEKLRERLFTSRARAAAVGSALFSSQLQVHLKYESGRFYNIRRATLRLDGANIYDDRENQVAKDNALRFEGFIAPGKHVLTVRIEAQARDDDRFLYTTEDTFTVDVPPDSTLVVKAVARDDGGIYYDWKRKQKGSYKLRLDVSVEAVSREKAKK